jgi:hypothetical protein
MNIALWVIAGLLAVVFLASGVVKLVRSKEKLVASGMGAVARFGPGTIRAIGILEVLAAVGLVLPALLDLAPVLVPLAAVGLASLMVGALVTHLRRGETPAAGVTLMLFALAAFVAWQRFGPESFTG